MIPRPANSLSITDFGAVEGNTTVDNRAAIENAIATAKAQGMALYVPPGTWRWGVAGGGGDNVIDLDGVVLTGAGPTSILYANNYALSAIFVKGNGAAVKNLRLTGAVAPARDTSLGWHSVRVILQGATNFTVSNNLIEYASNASIATAPANLGLGGAAPSGGVIANNTILNSLADSIHLTNGSNNIQVLNNRIENSGDDGIAVVSYQSDGARVHTITARNNVVRNNLWGRNMSVVGGQNILYENNFLEGNQWACVYLAQENSYNTYNVLDVRVNYNTLKNCGSATAHGGMMVFSDGAMTNNNITLRRNDIIATNQQGIKYFGPQTNLSIEENRYTGSGSAIVGSGAMVTTYTSGSVGYVAP